MSAQVGEVQGAEEGWHVSPAAHNGCSCLTTHLLFSQQEKSGGMEGQLPLGRHPQGHPLHLDLQTLATVPPASRSCEGAQETEP